MAEYMPLLSSLAKEGVSIGEFLHGDSSLSIEGTIFLDQEYARRLETSSELRAALKKRFQKKTTVYGNPDYKTLVLLCLSTSFYDVNEINLNNVSNEDVDRVWNFIDTLRVSSSADLSAVLGYGTKNRSGVGFKRSLKDIALRQQTSPSKSHDLMPSRGAKPSVQPGSYSHGSLEEVVTEDIVFLAKASEDPVSFVKGFYYKSRPAENPSSVTPRLPFPSSRDEL